MLIKRRLLAPGPTSIPESVLAVLGQPILHHRTPQFKALLDEVRQGLKYLFQTKEEVLLLASTGTGAMEAAVTNLFEAGDTVISVNGGKFGERWTEIAKAFGLQVVELKVTRGNSVMLEDIEKTLKKNPNRRGVLFQASETSTGVEMPTEGICRLTHHYGCLSVCDAITACGVFPLPMDEWGIDVLITGSQKALMIPPGLSLIALSQKAWNSLRGTHFYFDLLKEKKAILKNQTAWTPAISLIQALQESLKLIQTEGLTACHERHALLAEATRQAVKALGLELFANSCPSRSVTSVRVPEQIKDGKAIIKVMREKFGVVIAGGQDELEGKIIRLSHLGYCDQFDVITGISALELTLHELGYPVQSGNGVGAALSSFASDGNDRERL